MTSNNDKGQSDWQMYLEQERFMDQCTNPITHCVECGTQLSVFHNVRCEKCYRTFCQLTINEQADANRASAHRLLEEAKETIAQSNRTMEQTQHLLHEAAREIGLPDWLKEDGE